VRYTGGLLGGTWLTSLGGDLGNGKFDGAHLVQNFENLNPANTLWGKQYNLYSKVDTEEPRYLGFEKWWSGYFFTTKDEMRFITELGTVVAGNSELQPILDWIVQKTTILLNAEECSIKLLGADQLSTHTIIFDSRRVGPEAGSTSWPGPLRTSVMGFLMVSRAELATPDILADPRFPGLKAVQSSIRALLAVPLQVDGRITGLLAVSDTQPGRAWSPSDIALLSIVASNPAGVIEKARLRVEAQEKRRLEKEKETKGKGLPLPLDHDPAGQIAEQADVPADRRAVFLDV